MATQSVVPNDAAEAVTAQQTPISQNPALPRRPVVVATTVSSGGGTTGYPIAG